MKEIETTYVCQVKRDLMQNSVLIEALGEAVEIGDFHWIINSKLLCGAQDAIAAAARRATDHLSKLVTRHWNSALASANTHVHSNLFPVNQLAAGKWPPPHLHLPISASSSSTAYWPHRIHTQHPHFESFLKSNLKFCNLSK